MNSYWTEAAQLYLILHQSCFSLKSDHQDLLRSVCSSAEEWSSSHIFWGAFISSSLNQHCIICLDHLHLRHIIRVSRVISICFYISICCTVIDLHCKRQNVFSHVLYWWPTVRLSSHCRLKWPKSDFLLKCDPYLIFLWQSEQHKSGPGHFHMWS